MYMNLSKLGESGEQRSLACCTSWGHKASDTTYRLNNNIMIDVLSYFTVILIGLFPMANNVVHLFMCLIVICVYSSVKCFFFFHLFFISWRLIILQYCSSFLPYIDMNQPWIYTCSSSWTSLPLPSPSPPTGSSQCTSPEYLSHASNLDWWSVSLLIIYVFWCCSLR